MSELPLESLFELKRMRDALPGLAREDLINLIQQSMRLVKVKTNVYEGLMKNGGELSHEELHQCLQVPLESSLSIVVNLSQLKDKDDMYLRNVLSNYVEIMLQLDLKIKEAFKKSGERFRSRR